MKKVLVLEDEANIRSFIVINLRRAGYEVIEAESGEEALEKLEQHKDVCLCLFDVMLPGTDGIEVLKTLKSTAEYVDIPVIMATAKGAEFDKVQGLDLGADDYIEKSLDEVVADDKEMYFALIKLQEVDNPKHAARQNALRKYYTFKNGKEFPRLNRFQIEI